MIKENEFLNKTKDTLYVIFMGLIEFLSGSILLGGIRFVVNYLMPLDFVSILVYFALVRFLTKLVMRGVSTRSIFYSIYLPILSVLMYLLVNPIYLFIALMVQGASFLDSVNYIVIYSINTFISGFTGEPLEILLSSFYLFIELLVILIAVKDSYKLTK